MIWSQSCQALLFFAIKLGRFIVFELFSYAPKWESLLAKIKNEEKCILVESTLEPSDPIEDAFYFRSKSFRIDSWDFIFKNLFPFA